MPLRAPVLAAAAAAVTSAAAQQQNVLYFICDDLRPEFLAAYDQKVMITPAMDKLASEALVFDKAYCSVAVCSPSRNSFIERSPAAPHAGLRQLGHRLPREPAGLELDYPAGAL